MIRVVPLRDAPPDAVADALASAFRAEGHPPSAWRRLVAGDLAAGRVDAHAAQAALDGAVVVGATLAAVAAGPDGPVGHIGSTGVRPGFEGRGAGTALVAAAVEALSARGVARITLEVAPTNTRAAALYQRQGFVPRRRLRSWTLPAAPRPPGDARRATPAEVLAARPPGAPAFQRLADVLLTYAVDRDALAGWLWPRTGPPRAGALTRGDALFDLWCAGDPSALDALPTGARTLLHEPDGTAVGAWLADRGATPSAEVDEHALERS